MRNPGLKAVITTSRPAARPHTPYGMLHLSQHLQRSAGSQYITFFTVDPVASATALKELTGARASGSIAHSFDLTSGAGAANWASFSVRPSRPPTSPLQRRHQGCRDWCFRCGKACEHLRIVRRASRGLRLQIEKRGASPGFVRLLPGARGLRRLPEVPCRGWPCQSQNVLSARANAPTATATDRQEW